MNAEVKKLAEAIARTERVVVFTGAGISTESGVPDFRGPDGIWKTQQPITYQEFLASHEARARYWARKAVETRLMNRVEPNAAHRAIARLHELGKLLLLVTQNIDGLHQRAGLPADCVVELHGTNHQSTCLTCGLRRETIEVLEEMEKSGVSVPQCPCGGWLKPATISFGQSMPAEPMERARIAAEGCEVFLVVGSSLTVMPAAFFPQLAAQCGAFLAIVNQGATPYDDLAQARLDAKAGKVLSEVLRLVENG